MSRLDELIEELCPDGVEFQTLDHICVFETGEQLNKDKMLETGLYPVMNGGISPSGYWNEYNTEANTITISQGGASAGYVNYISTRFWAGAHCYVAKLITDKVIYKFLYYLMKNNEYQLMNSKHGAGIPGLNKRSMYILRMPVPPLPIQQEIVRILDNFTELTAELTAEIEARKKQYEYYRNTLLSFKKVVAGGQLSKLDELITELCPCGVEFVTVEEICNITRGRVLSKNYLRDNFGDYPVYSSQTTNNGIFGYINTFDYDCESVTWTTDGANAGSVFYHVNEKFSITNVCGLLRVKNNELVSTKFLFYVLQVYAKKYVNDGMGNPKLMSNVMAGISVPLPPLPVQQEIVRILDNFTELTTELEAELEARQKQYEYYRDKLLSFKEVSS